MKIERLTPKQEAELPAFRHHYLDMATNGARIARDTLGQLTDAARALTGSQSHD